MGFARSLVDKLNNNFVENALIVYIGKSDNLQNRIKTYLKFGKGKSVAHWGGRYIWQIKQHKELIICWKILLANENLGEVKKQLILDYKKQFNNKKPFANLRN